jgi:hypothetical protein
MLFTLYEHLSNRLNILKAVLQNVELKLRTKQHHAEQIAWITITQYRQNTTVDNKKPLNVSQQRIAPKNSTSGPMTALITSDQCIATTKYSTLHHCIPALYTTTSKYHIITAVHHQIITAALQCKIRLSLHHSTKLDYHCGITVLYQNITVSQQCNIRISPQYNTVQHKIITGTLQCNIKILLHHCRATSNYHYIPSV